MSDASELKQGLEKATFFAVSHPSTDVAVRALVYARRLWVRLQFDEVVSGEDWPDGDGFPPDEEPF